MKIPNRVYILEKICTQFQIQRTSEKQIGECGSSGSSRLVVAEVQVKMKYENVVKNSKLYNPGAAHYFTLFSF